MCGFVGWYKKDDHTKQTKKTLKKMNNTLKYRGPDQKGYYFDENIILGHRRLSIRDLKNGKQPMIYKNYKIVYNGEIYNTEEIRNKLKTKYTFETTSDTEVLLKGFAEYKEKILDMIEGIYAFAIYYDDKIFLARDRVGVKPLFYFEDNNNFIFASEIKAILKSSIAKPIIDLKSLQELLSLSPSRIPGSGIYKNIFELRPGHYMIYDKTPKIKRYWNIKNQKHVDNFEKTVENIKQILTNSIKSQMISDVEVASLLSGGLDSSIVTTVMSDVYKNNGKQLTTYSIDYEDNDKYFKGNNYQVSRDNEFIDLMKQEKNTNNKNMVIKQRTLTKY